MSGICLDYQSAMPMDPRVLEFVEAARLVHSVMKIIEVDFAKEVFRVSPKCCASLPEEYIDSTLAFIPTLKKIGYLARDLAKEEEIFYIEAIEKIHPE